MAPKKERLDVRLTEEGFFPSREKARAAIMAGLVFAGGQRAEKPGLLVQQNLKLEVRGNPVPYVSRGGLKLEKALAVFCIDLRGRVILDIGASTGGFTDCALKHGARQVYAVDVGYGQLAWELRNDARVVVLERTNIRYLTPDAFGELPDFVTIDVSFISLGKVLPGLDGLVAEKASGVALIKPQFEAGREKVGKKGVVRDPRVHLEIIDNLVTQFLTLGWSVAGLDYSPVTGPQGNIEYLLFFIKDICPKSCVSPLPVVQRAHAELRQT
ncbi:MAG: 16S/23S rRNA (cytidine-2'-O)-methyltransferase TlyA [Firmicutes bacterium ADurb.Bin456]|nr:MAG: 16S/23S rRNA (cytidine-2'-O)-methyltransferase TlyA [Firmicutes bacterium ADurb.Bin456]